MRQTNDTQEKRGWKGREERLGKQVLKIWEMYFKELLNKEDDSELGLPSA